MTVTCDCGRPVADAYVCADCAAELARDLGDVPALVEELGTMLAKQAVFADRMASRSAAAPLPFDSRASEAAWVLRSAITSTVRLVVEERGVPEPVAAVRRLARPRRYDWTSASPRGAQNGAQRCDTTDLLVENCAHCRRTA